VVRAEDVSPAADGGSLDRRVAAATASARRVDDRLTDRWRRGARLFAAADDEPRARRASDVVLLVAGAAGLVITGVVESPSPGFVRALATFAASLPGLLTGLWQVLLDLLVLLATGVFLASLVRRRLLLARDMLVAVALAVVTWLVAGRVVQGSWPAVWDGLRAAGPPPWYPSPRIALPAAVLVTASPHLTLPARRLVRWLVALAALGAAVLGLASPIGVLAGVLVAVVAAAATHMILGSSGGRPSLADVVSSLAELGVSVRSVGVATRQEAGVFVVDALDEAGDPLVVKVYGRDAHDTALAATVWRSIWYREQGHQITLGRRRQVEREALLTLLAAQAGVVTDRVVTAGQTEAGDALLVLRPHAGRRAWQGGDRGTGTRGASGALAVWAAIAALHDAGIVHGRVDADHLVVLGGAVGLVDFRGASVAPTVAQRRGDQAQALVATVLALGEAPALTAAREALGADGLAAVLPYLQRPALTPDQRADVRAAGVDLDDLRSAAASVAGTAAPDLERLRRISLGAIVRVALPAVAVVALLSVAAGVDPEQLADALRDASWWLVALGLVLGQLPRLCQAVSTLGASPVPLPLGPVYALQLAVSYVNLAVPSAAGRIAVNVRFFQRHGVAPGQAVAVGALDGVAGFVVQASLLALLLLATPATLDLQLDRDSAGRAVELLVLVATLAVGAVAVVLAVPAWRRTVLRWARHYLSEAMAAVRGLRSTRRLVMLLGGNLGSEILFATTLATFAAALGFRVGLGEALLINICVALLAGLMPIPGGIGVAEGGLTFGLISAGMPDEAAFGAVVLYRLATFYVPPVWGFFAMRWLERNQHL
jgi:glycosyltransferase 2 family protein